MAASLNLAQAFNVAFALSIGFILGGIFGASGDSVFNCGLAALGGMWLTLLLVAIWRR